MNHKLAYYKSVIGLLLWNLWIVGMFFHIYLGYRLFTQHELGLLIYFVLLELFQMTITKSSTVVKLFRYFKPIKMFDHSEIIEMEPIDKKNSLFGFHPHGIFTYGILLNLYTENTFLEDIVLVGSRMALNIPISGIFFRMLGLQGVNPTNLTRLLKSGQNVGLVPGGFEEAALTSHKENRLFLNSRKGFIKYALKHGVTLYPVFTFGENQLYNTTDAFVKFRLWLNKFKIGCAFFWSRFFIFPEPHTSLVTICGKGIKCPQIDNPSIQEIDKYHQLYVQTLKELYDTYSPKYAPQIPLVLY